MKYKKLLEAAKRMTITEEDVRHMKELFEEFDKRCCEEDRKNRVTEDFLNRTYTL